MPAREFLDVVDPWVNWTWLSTHIPYVLAAVQEHVTLTVIALVGGLAIALPLGIAARTWPGLHLRPAVLTLFGGFYTIPSIALFALLIPYTGLGTLTAEIPLVGYNVLILVRNVLVGLDSVSPDVLDAADGMGYRPLARLIRVELPLALPAIFAGLRVATVSTIGIVTITAVIGLGGLGQLILRGLIESFHTPLVVATALCILLAFFADLVIAGAQRLAIPWTRSA
jgi:osmoprotectant transport system permease protein